MTACRFEENCDFFIWNDGVVYNVILKKEKHIGGSCHFYFDTVIQVLEFVKDLRDKFQYKIPQSAIDKLEKEIGS
jgi:hypothetical protein